MGQVSAENCARLKGAEGSESFSVFGCFVYTRIAGAHGRKVLDCARLIVSDANHARGTLERSCASETDDKLISQDWADARRSGWRISA